MRPSSKSVRSPRNLLIRKPRNSAPLVRREQRHRADDRGEHAAALDVGDEHPRRAEARDEAEVHEIVRAQVQLADAAGALDHDRRRSGARDRRRRPAPRRSARRRRRSSRAARSVFHTRPCTTTWLVPLPFGLSRIGFIAGSGSSPHASACATCARPISPPPRHGYEWFDIVCALNGATRTPRPRSHAQIAVVIQLLPAFDDVPPMKRGRAGTRRLSQDRHVDR